MKSFLIIWIASTILVLFSTTTEAQNFAFNTDGLYNAELLDNIYRGHFENLKVNREDTDFFLIYAKYLRSYGERCDKYLPADKEMIMDDFCDLWNVTYTNGIETNRNCIRYVKIASNIYARRDLYEAQLELEKFLELNFLRELGTMMNSQQDAIGNSVDKIHKMKALVHDMSKIFKLNPCDNPALRRFEDNLKAFALNGTPVRMEGESKYTAMKKSGGPTGSQNFTKLIDDLITDQSRTWAFNRYRPGSVSGVNILATDAQGRPTEMKADYIYTGFGGDSPGWVKITFSNGLPDGIYFFDFPTNRKSPSTSIVASYAEGGYGN